MKLVELRLEVHIAQAAIDPRLVELRQALVELDAGIEIARAILDSRERNEHVVERHRALSHRLTGARSVEVPMLIAHSLEIPKPVPVVSR